MLKLRLQLRWLHFNFLQKSCLMMFTWNRLLLVSWIDKFIEDPHRDTWKACRCFINISVKFGRYPFVHTLWNKQSTVVKVFIILSTRQGKTKSSWGEIELLYFIFYRLLHMLYPSRCHMCLQVMTFECCFNNNCAFGSSALGAFLP